LVVVIVAVAVAGVDVGLETESSEADDVRLKDRRACANKLTAVRRDHASALVKVGQL
jgi:hypothetical protein